VSRPEAPSPGDLVPHVLIKGADYAEDAVVGADIVKRNGGRIYLAPLMEGQSTSGIVSRIHGMKATA